MENIGDIGVRPWVSEETKGRDAKGAFLKKFCGHREHMHWKDFLKSTAGSCL
jgi:hypothetical protein